MTHGAGRAPGSGAIGNVARSATIEAEPASFPGALRDAPGSGATRDNRGWYACDRLPHRDAPGLLQVITYRLADSIPAKVIAAKKRELEIISATRNAPGPDAGSHFASEPDALRWREQQLRKFIDDYEDAGYGECRLRIPEIAQIVADNWKHFDGTHYRLIAWCIMPNHVHILIRQLPGTRLQDLVDSWKSYTAKRANAVLGRTGVFWMRGFRDRFIRDATHFDRACEYIRQNPVKAGLVNTPEAWPWTWRAKGSVAGPGNAAGPAATGNEADSASTGNVAGSASTGNVAGSATKGNEAGSASNVAASAPEPGALPCLPALPKNLQTNLPSIEEIEAQFAGEWNDTADANISFRKKTKPGLKSRAAGKEKVTL